MKWPMCGALLVMLVLSLPGDTVTAQGEYNLDWHSIAGGGETRSAGGDYELAGTIGQSAPHSASGGDYELQGGFMAAFATPAQATPDDEYHGADVNRDGRVNASDIQLVINAVLGIPIDPDYDADVNKDGEVNAQDIQLVINTVLGIPTILD